MKLTLGFSTRDDSDGAWFTIESFLAHHGDALSLCDAWEIVVVDNSPPGSKHVVALQNYLKGYPNLKYIRANGEPSSCIYKDQAVAAATGDIYIGVDSHVLFDAGAVRAVVEFFKKNPHSRDLIMGPCFKRHDALMGTNQQIYTHEPYKVPDNAQVVDEVVWRGGTIGVWVIDERWLDPSGEPFEIQQQGTGAFACMRKAWTGFNPKFTGFGGNETHLMESFRSQGGRVLCHPGFRWIHRFMRAMGPPYDPSYPARVRNYLTHAVETDRPDLYDSAVAHFKTVCPRTTLQIMNEVPRPFFTIEQLRSRLGTHPNEVPGQIPDPLFRELQARLKPEMRTLEFGSGLSTLLFDHVGTAHTAVECDESWHKRVDGSLKMRTTKLIHSPIDEKSKWYEWRPSEGDQFDLILIDGPRAADQGDRAGCLHYLADILSPVATVIIDDLHREKDKQLAEDIAEAYGFELATRTLSNGRAFGILTRRVEMKILNEGPGTRLKQILSERYGMESQSSCGCNGRMREMNMRGTDWCKANIETITDWLFEGSQKWIAEQSGMKKTWLKIVPEFAKRSYIKSLVLEAIQQAETTQA